MTLALLLVLAQPCIDARPVEPGDTVECAGLIISEADARAALTCPIDLAHCQERAALAAVQSAADLVLVTAERDAARMALRTVEAVAVPPPAPWYERPAVTWPVGLAVGIISGAAVALALD